MRENHLYLMKPLYKNKFLQNENRVKTWKQLKNGLF